MYFQDDDGYSVHAGPLIFKNGGNYSLMYNNVNFAQGVGGCPDSNAPTAQDIYLLNNLDLGAVTTQLGVYHYIHTGEHFNDGSVNNGSSGCPELVLTNHVANGFTTAGVQSNPTVYFPSDNRPVVIWDQESAPGNPGNLKMRRAFTVYL